MNDMIFLGMLFSFSMISGLVTEAIKSILADTTNIAYNLIALVDSLVIGLGGMLLYYQLNSIEFTTNNIIYAILMGLACALCSMVGYDKVKDAIEYMRGGMHE